MADLSIKTYLTKNKLFFKTKRKTSNVTQPGGG